MPHVQMNRVLLINVGDQSIEIVKLFKSMMLLSHVLGSMFYKDEIHKLKCDVSTQGIQRRLAKKVTGHWTARNCFLVEGGLLYRKNSRKLTSHF